MAQNDTVDHLNRLIQINQDAEAGLRSAAESIKNSELETLFHRYAQRHAKWKTELQEEVKRLGGTPSDSGTLSGALQRGWMELKSALSGHSAAAILASCESGEESADVAYLNALDAHSAGQTHSLIEKQHRQIQEFRTHLSRLARETKKSVDFPQNE